MTFVLKLNVGMTFDIFEFLFSPSMRSNILSITCLKKLGFEFYFVNDRFLMRKNNKKYLFILESIICIKFIYAAM